MQQHHKDDQEILRKITVAIKQIGTEKVLGTGVIVTDSGLIITCYHVISNPTNRTIIDKTVDIYFPKAGIIKRAQALEEYCSPSTDIAFMTLEESLLRSDMIQAATLSESIYPMHNFQSFGFKEPKQFKGLYAHGEIQNITAKNIKDIDSSTDVIQLYSEEIGSGMSGAPILDLETERVIGIISDHYKSKNEVDVGLNFGIPVKSIIQAYPTLKKNNRGLVIGDFLATIKSSNDYYYLNIDYLYVPPREFDDIIKILEDDKVVIITGHPEYGKTYSAVRLLWDYYNNGYVPFLIEVEDRKVDLVMQINELRQAMQSKKIIVYLNDPFGKKEYNKDSDVESINDLINEFRNQDRSYLIITTRDKIYNKVKNTEFKSFKSIVEFQIDKPSYDDDKRKKILNLYAEYKGCKWFPDKTLKRLVLSWLKQRNMLPTLLNIHDFTSATVNVGGKDELRKIMEIKSHKTAETFAKEIKREYYDLMKFLAFPFISDWFTVEFVRTKYNDLIKNDKYQERYQFEKVAPLLSDKISLEGYVRFRHPSYSESLSYILDADIDTPDKRQEPNEIMEGFSTVLLKLMHEPYATSSLAHAIVSNFNKLPSNAQQLLFKLADDELSAKYVASEILYNYDKLPSNAQQLLFKISDNNQAAGYIAHAIASNFNKLPSNAQQLLFKLADNDSSAAVTAIAILQYYDKLPSNFSQQLLFKLAEKDPAAQRIASDLTHYGAYKKLPRNFREQLLLKLANNDLAATLLASEIANFNNRLSNIRDQMLLKLADKDLRFAGIDIAAERILPLVSDYSNNIPEDIRKKILVKLKKKGITRENGDRNDEPLL